MPKKFCCPECFDDRGLRRDVIPSLLPRHGKCDYCGSEDVDLVEPKELNTYFELLSNVYEPAADGKSLVEWMKDDWRLFSHPLMDIAHAKELLGEIMDDGDIVRQTFIPSPTYKSQGLIQWETLRDEMMYRNRWFLKVDIDLERLEELLVHLPADALPRRWFRARIAVDRQPFDLEHMGCPPNRASSHGRANPAGIPYLYLGSKPETAIAEVRPHTGETACVADFEVPEIKAIDLRDPRKVVSPFILSSPSAIGQLRADLPLLERLGEELTRPVLPQGAAIDYIPSQYLCEFVKMSGYDGVVYRSSVSDGFNLALFDPEKAVGGDVSLYSVTRVSVETKKTAVGPTRKRRSGRTK